MPIPDATPEDIRRAMIEFDKQLRHTPEWQGWEERGSYKYAIERGGKLYPVKKIVSMATGQPVGEFSGGVARGQANEFVRSRGFNVVELRRNGGIGR